LESLFLQILSLKKFMSLTISRSIEISERKKVGRNDPCYCGSDKKYKKCHLLMEHEYKPKSGLIERIVDWLTARKDFNNLLDKRFNEFFGGRKSVEELEIRPVMEAIIFSDKIGENTPFEIFLSQANLTFEEKELYNRWLKEGVFSFFEIMTINLGHSVEIKDFNNDKKYLVFEKVGTYGLDSGMVLLSRIVPYKNFWIFTGGSLQPFPKEVVYEFKKNLSLSPKGQLNQLELVRILYDKKDGRSLVNLSYEKLKEKLKKEVEKRKIEFDIDEVEKEIEKGRAFDIRPFITKFIQTCQSEEEAKSLIDLLMKFIQANPTIVKNRKEIGPRENAISRQLLTEVSAQKFTGLPQEERTKQINRFVERWILTEQKELGGKTPKEEILRERKSLGNPDQEINFHLSLEPAVIGEINLTKIYDLGIKLMKEKEMLKALFEFSKLANHIDSMPDNFRWYLNIGGCLFGLGETELADKYIKKSLTINPNYEYAKKTNESLKNEKRKKIEVIFSRQKFFYELLKVGLNFDFPINDNELIKDATTFLEYIKQYKVPITKVKKEITFAQVLELNKKLIRPDPEILKIEKTTYQYKYQWQMPKLNFLHIVFLVGGLIKREKDKLLISKKGEQFLLKNTKEKIEEIFYLWFYNTNWPAFQEREGWVSKDFSNKPIKILQDMSFLLISEIKRLSNFKAEDLLKEIVEIILVDDKDEQKKGFTTILSIFLETSLLKYLIWFGIIKEELYFFSKSKPLVGAKFAITSFGKSFIASIDKQKQKLIPDILWKIV